MMPRGKGAKQRRSTQRAAGDEVEGARRALNSVPGLTAAASADTSLRAIHDFAQDAHLDSLLETLAPKVGSCLNCQHMAAKHADGGACSMEGCSCSSYEAEAATSAFDAVEYAGDPGELAVVGFEPSDDRMEAAIAELTHRSPAAEPLVRLTLENMRLRRFVASPAPPITAPLDGGGDLFTLEWEAVLCPEGRLTEDGRAFAPGSIRWRELPLSLAAMLDTAPGHDGARVCGRIDRIWRDEASGLIRAAGVFDDSDYGREIARMVADGILRGNSVDIAPLEVEVGPASRWFDPDGNWAPQENAADLGSPEDVLFDEVAELPIVVVNDAVIGMSTVCPFPAFADARISVGESLAAAGNPLVWTLTLDAGYRVTNRKPAAPAEPEALTASVTITPTSVTVNDGTGTDSDVALNLEVSLAASAVASEVPTVPPADWFANPELDHLAPLVVTDSGRVYGHAAGWDTCHTGYPDVCVSPPSSETGYRFFHLKTLTAEDGSEIHVGTITLEAPHANQQLGLVDATSHYDNTGLAVADVAVGDDEHGIWVAGALRPGTSPETIRELRGAVLSGDWRNYEGNLELVALLAVNVPGFPIPQPRARVASGVMQTLVASGIVDPHPDGGHPGPLGAEWLPPAVDADTAAKLAALASPALGLVAQ